MVSGEFLLTQIFKTLHDKSDSNRLLSVDLHLHRDNKISRFISSSSPLLGTPPVATLQ